MIERRICCIEGCNLITRHKGKQNGKVRYGRYCSKHHKHRPGKEPGTHHPPNPNSYYRKTSFDNSKCQQCGWNKSYCDRHRTNPELGYVKGNVTILCPNCHRELHHDSSGVS